MSFEPCLLYVSKHSNLCLIIGSDGKTYTKGKHFGQFKIDENTHNYEDFQLPDLNKSLGNYMKVLKTVPTNADFWRFVLIPIVNSSEYVIHDGVQLPNYLNVYVTREGEYLGCMSKMTYSLEVKQFIPNESSQAIISLGFSDSGKHFEPKAVQELKVNAVRYSNVSRDMLKILSMKVGDIVSVKCALDSSMLLNISKSLGYELRWDSAFIKNSRKPVFHKEIIRIS